jgi:hypothetical protein
MDQGANLGLDDRATRPPLPTLASPVQPQSQAVPADDGLVLDDGQVTLPVAQGPRDPDSKRAISGPELWSPRRSLHNFELVAQGEVFEGDLLPGAEGCGECKKDDFKLRGMLCSPSGNRNGGKADGVFVSHSVSWAKPRRCVRRRSGCGATRTNSASGRMGVRAIGPRSF